MACEWSKAMGEEGLCEEVIEAILKMGFKRKASFAHAFVDSNVFEEWLTRFKLKLGSFKDLDDAEWLTSPTCGDLRAFWKKSSGEELPAPASAKHLPLLGSLSLPAKGAADREALLKVFESNYPGAALTPETTPCLPYLQTIQSQCQQKSWACVAWRRILSEAALWSRKAGTKKRDLTEVLAEAAGLCGEEWDLDMGGSPHPIFQNDCTRAHAYALCGGGHLQNWLTYTHKFISHYSRKYGAGWRAPNPTEAEDADREVLTEVFKHVLRYGVSLDTALDCVLREDFFRHYLGPRPRLVQKALPGLEEDGVVKKPKRRLPQPLTDGKKQRDNQAKGKLTGEPKQRAQSQCFAFKKTGKCAFGDDCKFQHAE